MHSPTLYALGALALSAPFVTISILFAYFFLRRAIWTRQKRQGKRQIGFCPSSFALGTALQFVWLLYRPSVEFAIKSMQRENVKDDDEGDPESPVRHLNHQLKRIRRGEPIDRLTLRL